VIADSEREFILLPILKMKYTEYLENIETILEKKTEIETYCDYKDKFFLSKEVVATYEFIRNEGIVFLE